MVSCIMNIWKLECLSRFEVLAVHSGFTPQWTCMFLRTFFLYSTYRENICFIFQISWEYLFYMPHIVRIFVLYSRYRENICFIFQISWERLFYIPNIVRIFVLYSTYRDNICFIFHSSSKHGGLPGDVTRQQT